MATLGVVLAVAVWWERRERERLSRELALERKLRFEERRGRTRAEVSLRNLRKQALRGVHGSSSESAALVVRPIGVVRSPFVKRAGTPRQGSLCPHARAVLKLSAAHFPNVTPSALEGLEAYSHAWVLFEFHANTDDPTKRLASKVQPPRGYGERVGWIATRSPHRANPLGLSLVAVAAVDAARLEVHLRAVDLCDGTPVFDLKPAVPWDQVADLRVPAWVSQNDEMNDVRWTPDAARAFLDTHADLVRGWRGLYGDDDDDGHSGGDDARRCVDELLRQDPRSKRRRHQRAAATEAHRKPRPESTSSFNFPFAGVEIFFDVDDLDLVVTVTDVRPLAAANEDLLCLTAS